MPASYIVAGLNIYPSEHGTVIFLTVFADTEDLTFHPVRGFSTTISVLLRDDIINSSAKPSYSSIEAPLFI
jgi:hypothetical protein